MSFNVVIIDKWRIWYSNYLTCKCLVNKLLINFWQLLKICSRQVKEVMKTSSDKCTRSAFSHSAVTAGPGCQGGWFSRWLVGKDVQDQMRQQSVEQLAWAAGDQAVPGRRRGCVLTFPCLLAHSATALDYETCSGNYFQRAHVPLVTAYFWIPGADAWTLMTFRGVFRGPSSD